MHPLRIVSALLCSSLAAAWSMYDTDFGNEFDLELPYKRDAITLGDVNAATPNPSDQITTPAPTQTSSEGSSISVTGSSSDSSSASGSSGSSGSQTAQTSPGSTTTSNTAPTSFSANLPPGGVSMLQPNIMSPSSYYKIGNYVTFAWNYTSLSVTPTAVDILATCTANQHTYTLALNQTVPANGTQAVTWDTGDYQATATVPLLTETYTLIIYDAAKSVSSTPSPGYLDTFDTFQFAMYTPQPYVNMSEYTCVTCSAGVSTIERQSVAVVALAATFAVLGASCIL